MKISQADILKVLVGHVKVGTNYNTGERQVVGLFAAADALERLINQKPKEAINGGDPAD